MYDNLMFAFRSEFRGGKIVESSCITPDEYRNDVLKNLYYREVHGNRRQHKCLYKNERDFNEKTLVQEWYGNGYSCTWLTYAIPRSAGYRERDIIEHMTSIESVFDNGRRLVTMHAIVGDDMHGYEHRTCTYDLTNGKFVG